MLNMDFKRQVGLWYQESICPLRIKRGWERERESRFTLWWRSPPVMNYRGILKFDWPRATLVSIGGLHYGQEFENIMHGWEMTCMPMWRTHYFRGVLWRSSFLGNLKASDKKLDLRRTPTLMKYFIAFSSSPAYHPLPHIITNSFAKTLDRPVHFSIVV